MRAIETNGIVKPDGQMSIQVPQDITPGEHSAVVVIDEQPLQRRSEKPPSLPVFHVGAWPEGLSLRREDLYDDGGR